MFMLFGFENFSLLCNWGLLRGIFYFFEIYGLIYKDVLECLVG